MHYYFVECCFEGWPNKFIGFKAIGDRRKMEGLPDPPVFYKAMGSGAGSGFSIVPDFGRYSFILGFETNKSCDEVLQSLPYEKPVKEISIGFLVAKLTPINTKGTWGKENPFSNSDHIFGKHEPVCVLTRATIRTRKLLDFWANVPAVARYMKNAKGVWFQTGVGEYPIFMQATVSIWENRETLMKIAYGRDKHQEVVKKTRARNWYREELFAQFRLDGFRASGPRYTELSEKLLGAGIPVMGT
jgi:hypothetical protein